MRPSPALQQRLKARLGFTTKDVAKGFYRGTGVGSLGAHTDTGRYVLDYRKARHFVIPNLSECQLPTFVTAKTHRQFTHTPYDPDATPNRDLLKTMNVDSYLHWFFEKNDGEVAYYHEETLSSEAQQQKQTKQIIEDNDFLEAESESRLENQVERTRT